MTIDLAPDYKPKILHVGIRKPISGEDDNGIIYNPRQVYSKVNTTSERMYEKFFKIGLEVAVFPIQTEQGPGELVKMLAKKHGVEYCMAVGGIVAPFKATEEQAKRLIEDLRNNPQRYFTSKEKKEFW